jgi:hypothetical protein
MSDETILNDTKSLVPLKYYEMFAFKILGLTYAQIAEKTEYSEARVKALFSNSGVLGKLWKEWVEKAKGESLEESLNMMFGHLSDIVRARILDAKQLGTPAAVASSKMIFDLTIGKPEERHKISGNLALTTVADLIKAATLKKQENEQRERDNPNINGLAEKSD